MYTTVYFPTFTIKNQPNVGKYNIHGSCGIGPFQKSYKKVDRIGSLPQESAKNNENKTFETHHLAN